VLASEKASRLPTRQQEFLPERQLGLDSTTTTKEITMANATLDDQHEELDLNDTSTLPDDTNPNEDRGDNFTPTDDTPAEQQPKAAEKPAEDADEAAAEDDGRKNGSRMVPITRFNEVNERMKELAAQNQQLIEALTRGQTPQQTQAAPAEPQKTEQQHQADIKTLRQQYQDALLNGRDEEALNIQEKIDDAIEAKATERAMERLNQTLREQAQKAEQQSFQQVVSEMERNYPALDANSDEANEDAILYVVAKRDALIRAGQPLAEALRNAVGQAAKVFGLGGDEQPSHNANQTAQNRKEQALQRNAQAANAQPPQVAGLGNRATAPQRMDVSKMSEAEFEALPESEKARLRGD
jgi:hypothetical protein